MNNLHHILNILFFFIRLFTISHTCTPPYIKSFIRPSSIRWKFDSKKEMKLYTLTTMKMRLKNNWNDKILLESSYRKSKFNTHHFKQIIITWLQKLKKKISHFFIGKKCNNNQQEISSYKYEATVYKIQKAVKILQYNFWKTPFDICRLEWCTTQNVCFCSSLFF